MAKQLDFTKYKTLQQFFRAKSRWVKGKSISKDGTRYCLLEAASRIYSPPSKLRAVQKMLNNTIKQLSLRHTMKYFSETVIVDFNDDPRTTIEDIRRVCKEAGV